MKTHLTRRFLALALAVVMVLGLLPGTAAASKGLTLEKSNIKVNWDKSDRHYKDALHTQIDTPLPTAQVRVAILLEEPATAQRYSTNAIGSNAEAKAYHEALAVYQEDMAKTISAAALDGKKLDVVWNLTLITNMISANVPYGKLDAIRAVPGVRAVTMEQEYEALTATKETAKPNMYSSAGMIGSTNVWASGYTGAGTRIAIVDTGTDTNHQSMDNGAFLYALEQNAQNKGLSASSYKASLDLLDAAEIAGVLNQLNVTERIGATAQAYYLNEKLPFAANYVDCNLVVDHDSDSQSDHGSHVAGIAAANRYIPGTNGYELARDTVRMNGVAPDAQILTMKVFGNASGPYDSDFFAAIEDAIWLGCDSVNLSLGSNAAGFGYDPYFADILDFLTTTDTVVAISAGNAGTWADSSAVGNLYHDGVNFDTVGSPGSYTTALTVASVDNDGTVGEGFTVGSHMVVFNEGQGGQKGMSSLDTSASGGGTTYEYIFVDGVGNLEDYSGMNLQGKVVFCSRGELNFGQKAQNAAQLGAAATVIYNNQYGSINMDLSGYTYDAPCVSILQADADVIRSLSTARQTADGRTYYTGTMTVSRQLSATEYNSEYYTMSSFSSWGVPGSLELKPEITAPGGMIWSLNGLSTAGTSYQLMSGTSMAAPQVAGMAALVSQYIQENGLDEKHDISVRHLAQSLLMSTAEPLFEEQNDGGYYSVINQGAGLARVDLATSAESYVLVEGQPDGKVKAELGDDPDRLGDYGFTFSLNNMDGTARTYVLRAELFTQDTYYLDEATTYLRTYTRPMAAKAAFYRNGNALDSIEGFDRDLNGDGVTNTHDADHLLEYLLGNVTKLHADGDINGDGKVNTYDAHVLLGKSSGYYTIHVPANGSVTVDVRMTLTAEEKAKLEAEHPAGAYVEGFVYAEPMTTSEGDAGVTHSIPVLGYYGSWTDSRMFDVGGYLEYTYGTEERPGYLYHVNGNQTNFMTIDYGDGTEYVFGGNPIVSEQEYLPYRNAFNNENDARLSWLRFALIRNSADTRMQVVNNTTGEVYYDVPMGQMIGAFYDSSSGNWAYTGQMMGLGLDMKGESEGTELEVRLVAVPEYYRYYNEENGAWTFDYDALGEGAYLRFPFTIDNTAPELLDYNLNDNELTVTASDNEFVAAVALMNLSGTTAMTAVSPNQTEQGADVTVKLDLSKVFGQKFLLAVFDYAENVTTYEVTLDIDNDRPRFTAIDRKNTDAYWNLSYVGLLADGDSVKLGTCADREPARAAEYVDGAVFEVSNDNQLYVGYDNDLSGLKYLSDLDPSGQWQIVGFNDLAYNTQDGKLYGSFYSYMNEQAVPYLCTIDMDNGEMTMLGEMPVDVNSMTIDDNGNFYSAGYSASRLYTYKADVCETGEVTFVGSLDGFSSGILNSMAWDHETDELFWACCGNGATNFLKIDPATAAVEWLDYYSFTMVGLYVAAKNPGDTFAPTNRVDSVRLAPVNGTLVNNTTKLVADVMPWYVSDSSVTWTSSNSSVASVDANGIVTGHKPGTVTITATSKLDPTMKAQCEFTVASLGAKFNALVWDEEGIVSFGSFDADAPATSLNKGTAVKNNLPLNSTAIVNGTLYASSMDTSNLTSDLYTVDPETFALTLVGGTEDLAYTDMAYLPGTGYIMATFGSYVAAVDPATGDYVGAFNWYGDVGNLVGITYYGSEFHEGYGLWMDYVFLLDDQGNVFFDAFIFGGEANNTGYFNGTDGYIQSLGNPVDTPYFQGFHYDGSYVYWNRFSEAENSVELKIWDCDNTLNVYTMGRFPTGIWPIAGLYTDAEVKLNSVEALKPMGTELHGMVQELDISGMKLQQSKGSVNGFEVQAVHAPLSVTVPVTVPAEGTNGIITASFDTNALELTEVTGISPAFAYRVEKQNTVTVAFAEGQNLGTGTAVAYLHFTPKVAGTTTVSFATKELGENQVSLKHSIEVQLPDRCPSEHFVDVKETNWFHEAVDYVAEHGIMTGMDPTHFGPMLTMTRAQLVTVLHRLDGSPEVAYEGNFTDVKASNWYATAVAWAVETGITNGVSPTKFDPEGKLTRTELVVFLHRFAQYIGCDMTATADLTAYRDHTSLYQYSIDAWRWAITQGIIQGMTPDTLSPRTTTNRAEAATIFMRFMKRYSA